MPRRCSSSEQDSGLFLGLIMETSEPIRVMVAEDEVGFRRMLALFLESVPDIALVASAINGEEAVRLYAEYRPDIVIMDITMPVMDGLEATKLICRDNPHARVILFSAYHNLLYRERVTDVGAVGKLAKPLRLGELLKAIRHVHAGLPVDGAPPLMSGG
jgi:DNA-binding NarL/FixJ family response regulator